MALVHKTDEILGEKVQEGVGRLSRFSAVEIAGIVLYARAVAHLAHHFHVVIDSLVNALRLDELALPAEELHPLLLVGEDPAEYSLSVPAHDIVGGGEDDGVFQLVDRDGGEGVYLAYPFHRVPEKFHADGDLGAARREDVHRIAAHAEGGSHEIEVRTLVLHIHQPANEFVGFEGVPLAHGDRLSVVVHGRAQAVDAGHARHHDDIAAFAKGCRCGMAQLVYLVVDLQLLLDVGVRARDVRLRLVVVVVADEKFHAVVREKLSELVAKLRRESLVVRDDEGGTLQSFDDVRHCESLAAARHAEQDLGGKAALQPCRQFLYRGGLIAAGRIVADKFKAFHSPEICCMRILMPQAATPESTPPATASRILNLRLLLNAFSTRAKASPLRCMLMQ